MLQLPAVSCYCLAGMLRLPCCLTLSHSSLHCQLLAQQQAAQQPCRHGCTTLSSSSKHCQLLAQQPAAAAMIGIAASRCRIHCCIASCWLSGRRRSSQNRHSCLRHRRLRSRSPCTSSTSFRSRSASACCAASQHRNDPSVCTVEGWRWLEVCAALRGAEQHWHEGAHLGLLLGCGVADGVDEHGDAVVVDDLEQQQQEEGEQQQQ